MLIFSLPFFTIFIRKKVQNRNDEISSCFICWQRRTKRAVMLFYIGTYEFWDTIWRQHREWFNYQAKMYQFCARMFRHLFFLVKWSEGEFRELCNFGYMDEGFSSQIDKYFRFKLWKHRNAEKQNVSLWLWGSVMHRLLCHLSCHINRWMRAAWEDLGSCFLCAGRPRQDVDIHHGSSTI